MRRLAPLAAALLLSGCLSFGEDPPASLLTLAPAQSAAAGASRSAAAGDAITVLQPRVPNALATNRVPVTSGGTAIAYVKNAQWVDTPDKLFRELVSETITARTGRLVLDARQVTFDPGTTISGDLRQFGVDGDRGEAVVTYDAARQIGVTGTRASKRGCR